MLDGHPPQLSKKQRGADCAMSVTVSTTNAGASTADRLRPYLAAVGIVGAFCSLMAISAAIACLLVLR